jgi:crotonobetainyl-CoA:carnitine CoA-transferase CaiB-like acyl-CoA transferase
MLNWMPDMSSAVSKPVGALSDVRVLDLSRILAGPTATQLLGDFGADIIKVERPGAGDDTRAWGPPFVTGHDGKPTDESAYYLCANRNKRSIGVDVSKPEGAETIREILAHCDVLIENFKPGGLAKYGLSYEDLRDEFPSLVYCSISGFGQMGPHSEKPGYDLLAQAYGGIMSLTGEPEGEPMKVAVGIADVMTGMYASNAILAALRHKDRTNEGQHIDIALVDCQIAWLINEGTNYLTSGHVPKRRGNGHPNIVPYQVFEMSDGHAVVAVGNDQQFIRFCDLIGQPDLAQNPLYATNAVRLVNRISLIEILSGVLGQLGRDWLISGMEANGIPGGAINRLDDVFASDQVAAREMKISMPHPESQSGTVDLIGNPVKFSKTPVTYRRPPPLCGADTEEIISEFLSSKSKK